jgi:hypothetical protein
MSQQLVSKNFIFFKNEMKRMPASPPFPPNVKPIVLMLLEFKSQHSKENDATQKK